jgi:hypothetical protein
MYPSTLFAKLIAKFYHEKSRPKIWANPVIKKLPRANTFPGK